MTAVLLLLAGFSLGAETVTLRTDDGWTLAATYSPARKGKPSALLVHGLAAGRGEYDAFAARLQERGWGTLAVDLRGHGGSARPGGSFETIADWSPAALDLLAASKFLEARGVKESDLALIGGSLGANLCAKLFAALPRARRLVLLSPGADYRGLRLPRVDGKRTIAAASRADEYSFQTVADLKKAAPGLTLLEAKSGHGAQMLADPALLAALLKRL